MSSTIEATMSPVTTGPITGSSKAYLPVPGNAGMCVPVRRVVLTTGDHLDLYDTSGPYTDRDAQIDLQARAAGDPVGLGPAGAGRRGRHPAWCGPRAGIVTPEMAYIAVREGDAGRAGDEARRRRRR